MQDVTGMARVVKQSHLLLTDAMAKLGDNIATTLEKVVGWLNKLEEQSNNCSDRSASLKTSKQPQLAKRAPITTNITPTKEHEGQSIYTEISIPPRQQPTAWRTEARDQNRPPD